MIYCFTIFMAPYEFTPNCLEHVKYSKTSRKPWNKKKSWMFCQIAVFWPGNVAIFAVANSAENWIFAIFLQKLHRRLINQRIKRKIYSEKKCENWHKTTKKSMAKFTKLHREFLRNPSCFSSLDAKWNIFTMTFSRFITFF